MADAKSWICPRCKAVIAVRALRCRSCGAPLAGRAALEPHQLAIGVKDSRTPQGGLSVSFGVDFTEGRAPGAGLRGTRFRSVPADVEEQPKRPQRPRDK